MLKFCQLYEVATRNSFCQPFTLIHVDLSDQETCTTGILHLSAILHIPEEDRNTTLRVIYFFRSPHSQVNTLIYVWDEPNGSVEKYISPRERKRVKTKEGGWINLSRAIVKRMTELRNDDCLVPSSLYPWVTHYYGPGELNSLNKIWPVIFCYLSTNSMRVEECLTTRWFVFTRSSWLLWVLRFSCECREFESSPAPIAFPTWQPLNDPGAFPENSAHFFYKW